MTTEKIVGIIPAKGHSRRIPGKNMRSFNGKPLLFYTIQNILSSQLLDVADVFVSTDSDAIKTYCKDFGIHAPFSRPPEHSQDEVHSSVPILDLSLTVQL